MFVLPTHWEFCSCLQLGKVTVPKGSALQEDEREQRGCSLRRCCWPSPASPPPRTKRSLMGRKACGRRGDVISHLDLESVAQDHSLGPGGSGGGLKMVEIHSVRGLVGTSVTSRDLWGGRSPQVLGEDLRTPQTLVHSCGLRRTAPLAHRDDL